MTILRFVGWAIGIMIVIAAGASVWVIMNKPPSPVPAAVTPGATTTPPRVVAEASYLCDGNRTLQAVFMDTTAAAPAPTADTPPTPTGSVSVTLDSAPAVSLVQSISADGARYGNQGDALVFWTKGAGALVLQNGTEGMYTNCIVVKENTGGLSQVYHDGAAGFTMRYPVAFGVTATYTYDGLGTKKGISGVKFTIPAVVASGTNLSSDSYLSIEHLGTTTATCDAGAFLLAGTHATATTVSAGTIMYSITSSTGAAAGNRYEEVVYALPGSNPCLAVRTYIHYGVLENYATGTVKAFDRAALEKSFVAIRDSVTFVPHVVPIAPIVPVSTSTKTATTSTAPISVQ